jgi:hypothetical protein
MTVGFLQLHFDPMHPWSGDQQREIRNPRLNAEAVQQRDRLFAPVLAVLYRDQLRVERVDQQLKLVVEEDLQPSLEVVPGALRS